MMSPEFDFRNVELRRRELLRQAKIEQLAAEARRNAPALQQRLLVLLSDLMISGGSKLQQLAGPDRASRASSTSQPEWIATLSR